MTFKVLNLAEGIKAQDFQRKGFDIILAGGSLYSTRSLSIRLQDIKRTLKPGGRLLICDVIALEDLTLNFGFGVWPEWWQGSPLTVPKWDTLLRENHFSGHDLVIRDSNDDSLHQVSIMATTTLDPHEQFDGAKVVLIAKEGDDYQMEIALALARKTFKEPKYRPLIVAHTQPADTRICAKDYVLLVVDMGKPTTSLLAEMSESTFTLVRGLVQESVNILWVSSSSGSPYSGIKDGFLRTLRSEFSSKRLISFTLEVLHSNTLETVSRISKVFNSAFIQRSPELEYVEQEGYILIGRLVEDGHLNFELSSSIHPETRTVPWLPGPPLKLDMSRRGQLETIYIEDAAYYKELGPTEVEIEAKAWAVNFRDVFGALGRLDDPGFGFDCAGIVTRVGAACQTVQPGGRVYMCVVDCMRMYPRGDERVVVKISPSLSFEEACAVIVPGTTALQSLVEIARISQGEKILIHAASGATGQLAIQIAKRAGAEVFATVGYNNKKQLLIDQYGILADHIFYSRSNNFTFAQDLMRATNGYGVDVVLNSLVGEGLRASWECIAPYGRFVEIGKTDINANSPLPMASFATNATFASLDARHMLIHRKQLAKELLHKTMTMVADGSIHNPKPLHIYDVGVVENAFRYIQSGKNTGRVVIRIDSHTEVRKHLITPRTWKFCEDASYLVAGGLGGIGRSMLKWMASRGAKNLIVPSRTGLTSAEAIEVVSELEKRGVKVITPKCDVSSRDSLSQTLTECATTLPRIRGCINAAMVLNDSVFDNMSFAQWDRTIRSKVATSWNLHSLLTDLDFMIFLSSVSGVVGNPGQSNYAGGCTFQDTLAQLRARRGLKTTSIDLGVMRTSGVVAESDGTQGLGQIEDHELFALLDVICDPAVDSNAAPSQIVVGLETPMGLSTRSLETPETMQRPLFAYFSQASSSSLHNTANSNVATLFRQAETAEDQSSLVAQSLASRLARSLAIKPEDIDVGKPLHAFGVDSLVAVELRNWISKEFAADVPVFELIGGRTVEGVGEFVGRCSQIMKMS
ncbi:KR-domain-containing protein [Xylaria palmicola]|nr:KR-domain-containing protein [Xylaria palmicola]